MSRSDPGRDFEAQVVASLKIGDRWVWDHLAARIVPDPPTRRGGRCEKCRGELRTYCVDCRATVKHPPRFSSPNPWDVEIRWKLEKWCGAPDRTLEPRRYELLAECKSTKVPRLPFSVLKMTNRAGAVIHWQELALRAQARAGAFAGVLWELRRPGQPWLVAWIPIEAWRALRLTSPRKSITWEQATDRGILVREDAARMRRAKRHYYNMASLLAELAGTRPQP